MDAIIQVHDTMIHKPKYNEDLMYKLQTAVKKKRRKNQKPKREDDIPEHLRSF